MELRAVQKELKVKLRVVREQHNLQVKEAFSTKNTKQLWDSRILNTGKREMVVLNELEKANELNNFYKRFDSEGSVCIDECRNVSITITCDPTQDRIVIDPSAIAKVFKKLHTKKASGPDGISAFLLNLHIMMAEVRTMP